MTVPDFLPWLNKVERRLALTLALSPRRGSATAASFGVKPFAASDHAEIVAVDSMRPRASFAPPSPGGEGRGEGGQTHRSGSANLNPSIHQKDL